MFKYIFENLFSYFFKKYVAPRVRELNASMHDDIFDSFDPEELLSIEVNLSNMVVNHCIEVPEDSDIDYTIEAYLEGNDDMIVCHISPHIFNSYLKVGETPLNFNKITVTKAPDGYIMQVDIPLFNSKISKGKRLNKEKQ